jgi:hypothetical protein
MWGDTILEMRLLWLTLAVLTCAPFATAQQKAEPEEAAPAVGTWRSYPIGAYARTITKTIRENGDAKKTEEVWDSKTTLIELTKTGTVLEWERTYKGSTTKEKKEMPYEADSTLDQLTAAWTALKGGTETVTIGNRKIECKVFEKRGANQIVEKIWFSGEVPGNIVKSESHFAGPYNIKLDTFGQVTEFKGKKP